MMTLTHAFILLGTLFGLMIIAAIVTHRRVRLRVRILMFLMEYGGVAADTELLKRFLEISYDRCLKELWWLEKSGHVRQVLDEERDFYWTLTSRGYKALKYHQRN